MRNIGKKNKEIEKIDKKLASMSLSREERNNYEFRRKAILDEISAIDFANRKGLAKGMKKGIRQGIDKGMEEGLKQGTRQEKEKIAKQMKNKNMDKNLIIELTGLTEDEIDKI